MRQKIARVFGIIFFCILLTGCGRQKLEKETWEDTISIYDRDKSSISSEITIWCFPNFAAIDETSGKYEQQLIEAFENTYPNIKVNLKMLDFSTGPDEIEAAIEDGSICDILFDAPGRIMAYAKAGHLIKLNDLFTNEFIADVGNENIISACQNEGDYYMFPLSTAPFLMAFNKDMLQECDLLEKFNLTGDRTWTLDTYKDILEQLLKKEKKGAVIYCSSQGGDQGTRAYIANLYGSSIMDYRLSKYVINNEYGIAGMEFVKEAVQKGLLTDGRELDSNGAIEAFVTGEVSHTILFSPGLYASNKEKMSFEPLFVPYPSASGVPALEYLINGFCIFNHQDQERAAAAKIFLDFACNDEVWGPKNVRATNAFSVHTSHGNLYEGDEDMTYLSELSKYYAPYYNTVDGFAQMRPLWFSSLQNVLAGQSTPKEALDFFAEQANLTLEETEDEE